MDKLKVHIVGEEKVFRPLLHHEAIQCTFSEHLTADKCNVDVIVVDVDFAGWDILNVCRCPCVVVGQEANDKKIRHYIPKDKLNAGNLARALYVAGVADLREIQDWLHLQKSVILEVERSLAAC